MYHIEPAPRLGHVQANACLHVVEHREALCRIVERLHLLAIQWLQAKSSALAIEKIASVRDALRPVAGCAHAEAAGRRV